MSSKTSRKARKKRGSQRPSDEVRSPNPQDAATADVLEKALGELMEMSDDELLDSLHSLGSSSSDDAPENSPSDDPKKDSTTPVADAVHAPAQNDESKSESTNETVSDASSETGDDDSDQDLVEDPTTLSLIQKGVVNIDQVSEALQIFDGCSGELWRFVAEMDGVNSEAVFAAVAKGAGFPAYLYLDAAPTRELIEELLSYLSEERLTGLLDRSLLPVDLEPLSDDTQYRLMIVTHDPTDRTIAGHLKSTEINGVCLFAPRTQVAERIDTIRGWLASSSPFGLGAELESAVEPDSEPENDEFEGETSCDTEEPRHERVTETGAVSGDGFPESESAVPEEAEVDMEGDGRLLEQIIESDAQESEVLTISSYDDDSDLPSLLKPASRDRVLRSLLRQGQVTEKDVQEAIAIWQKNGGKDAIWRVLADLPDVNREAIYEEAARVYAFKQEEIVPGRPDHDFIVLTIDTIAEDQREELLDLFLLPFEHVVDYETGAGRMVFVTPDPTRPEVNRLLHELDLGRFELRYAPESAIGEILDELFPRKNEYLERMSDDAPTFDLGTSYDEAADIVDEEALDAEINRSKLINLFEASLVEATRMGASDIHIYPNPKRQVEIHFRLDGRLKKWHTEEGVAPESFLSVVKDNCTNVDRFERDSAQDGFIQRRIDDTLIRFRVSILPIATANQEIRAESVVIRILDDRKVITELSQLGMLDTAMARFDQAIRQPHGMLILTGPTGSGKSTTLVASLHQVVTPELNVLTVEDPVEYIIKGVRQIKLSHKLDLESAMRSILRHDPDIVMVGEMRDQATAELAIKLANTGHLTFSTLHTNDAPAAISRLYKMGVEPFLIAYAINLVVAQRLIRTVCPTCKTVDEEPDTVLMKSLGWTVKEIGETTVYKANTGSNCKMCSGVGYKGRRAICETLYFTDEIRHMIAESGTDIDEQAIREAGQKDGMLTLMDSAKRLVEMGVTTVEEMLRVVGAE